MMRLSVKSALMGVALMGCGGGFEPYYADGLGPQIGAIEPDFESGNAGGQVVTISGGNFGSSAEDVVVLFDNHNAEVLSVENNQIVAKTPQGPITGGGVEVLVANANGYDLRKPSGDFALYKYGQAVFDENSESLRQTAFYAGQRHYVQVSSLYDSCYGGRGLAGCGASSFNGETGIDGNAEFLRFGYPRLHTTGIGWLTAYDAPVGEWRVGSPAPVSPSGIDDLKQRDVPSFDLINPALEGAEICVDLTADSLEFATKACTGGFGERTYDLGVLKFCEQQDAVDGGTGDFRPDWPVNRDFFEALPGESMDVELKVYAPINVAKDLVIPPKADFDAEYGFEPSGNNPWAVSPIVDCPDSNEDGIVSLDEDGMVLTWTPLDPSFKDGESTNSFIHVAITFVDFAWFGLETTGVRASIVVPDDHEIGEDGLSRLSIPNEILYQIPSPNFNWSGSSPQSGYLGRYSSNPSYLFMEAYRVTDYRIPTADGSLIFSYSSGELTLLTDFSNPLFREDSCDNCVDDDGDGWNDDLDPDCNEDFGGNGDNEEASTSEFTCNDGIDNNGDGLIDADDPLCEAGWFGETTCLDGVDNDGDGWLDGDDPDCTNGGEEDGTTVSGTCNDGLDNDGDGWVDAQDPGCTDAFTDEDDGYSGTACNDGLDNDGHGDVDAMDIYCLANGATADQEEARRITGCANTRDDDSDGYTDGNDPDCETAPYSRENASFFDAANPAVLLVPECYDNIDNDGDGTKDADDPGCWNPAATLDGVLFAPDGFLMSEGANRGTPCTDNLDSDGDGWADGLDPDCQPGDASTQVELGFGTTKCNDGIDNDGDGKIDSEDSLCKSGYGNFEG